MTQKSGPAKTYSCRGWRTNIQAAVWTGLSEQGYLNTNISLQFSAKNQDTGAYEPSKYIYGEDLLKAFSMYNRACAWAAEAEQKHKETVHASRSEAPQTVQGPNGEQFKPGDVIPNQ